MGFTVGNGGMDYGDDSWGLYRGYYRDPFPHSLLSTRQIKVWGLGVSTASSFLSGLPSSAWKFRLQSSLGSGIPCTKM